MTLLDTCVVFEVACKIGICAFAAASTNSFGGSSFLEIIKHGVSGLQRRSITSNRIPSSMDATKEVSVRPNNWIRSAG